MKDVCHPAYPSIPPTLMVWATASLSDLCGEVLTKFELFEVRAEPPLVPPSGGGLWQLTCYVFFSRTSHVKKSESVSLSVVSSSLQPQGLKPTRLLCP